MPARTYVIAGAGLAGIEAAGAIRQHDADGRIVVVGDESLPFYSRIRLPEFVAGTVERDKLVVKKPTWYDERAIELIVGRRVASVDASGRTITIDDGTSIAYDALILATGARCFVPPFPGADLDGVVAVRSVDDAAELRRRCQGGGPVVVIGGGLLGLEMAAARGTFAERVVVVEIAPWLLPRQLDREGGYLLQSMLEAKRLEFRTAAQVAAVTGETSVTGVRLADGEELPATVVVVSAGVRPNTDLARAGGCTLGKGIVVDDRMATSVDGIFAAGDCTEHRGRLYGIWPAAEAQGRVAGAAAAGAEASYGGTVPSNRLKVTGIDVFSAGDFDPDGKLRAEIERGEGTYRKLVHDSDDMVVGAILIGDMRDQRAIARAIDEGRGS